MKYVVEVVVAVVASTVALVALLLSVVAATTSNYQPMIHDCVGGLLSASVALNRNLYGKKYKQ